MDPSQIQSDTNNDVHSLEGTGTVIEPGGQPTTGAAQPDGQTPAGNTAAAPGAGVPPEKHSRFGFITRIWRKFNIYLLLFILVVLVACVVSLVLFVKGRQTNTTNNNLTPQNLSTNALKQLADTSDVTIGNAKQILNVASNAVFSGSVLVRNNLEIAGSLKIGGSLSLPGINVSGASTFGPIQAETLAVTGPANVAGVLTAKHGLSVTGDGTFSGGVTAANVSTGGLTLNGDLTLTHHVTAGGPIPSLSNGTALGGGGTASVSGSDTAGSVTINTGSNAAAGCFATITFTHAFNSTPHLSITPVGNGAADIKYYVNRSTASFSICTVSPPPSGQTFGFDYIALG